MEGDQQGLQHAQRRQTYIFSSMIICVSFPLMRETVPYIQLSSHEFSLLYFLDRRCFPFNPGFDMDSLCSVINDLFTTCAFGTAYVSDT
jgi:hypothetical protein